MVFSPQRPTRAAAWSRRFGVFAAVLLAVSTLASRAGLTDGLAGPILIALALGLAALGALAGLVALARIWHDGLGGLKSAALGLVCALAVLAVPVPLVRAARDNPAIAEVSTDLDDPPAFGAALRERPPFAPPLGARVDAQTRELQRQAFPDLATLRIEAPPTEVFEQAVLLATQRGWRIVERAAPVLPPRPPPPPPPPRPTRPGLRAAPAPPAPPPPPPGPAQPGRIEAVARTRLFGFRDDVVIRIRGTATETLVDMRSASRIGWHDLGANAARVEAFLTDLRDAMAER